MADNKYVEKAIREGFLIRKRIFKVDLFNKYYSIYIENTRKVKLGGKDENIRDEYLFALTDCEIRVDGIYLKSTLFDKSIFLPIENFAFSKNKLHTVDGYQSYISTNEFTKQGVVIPLKHRNNTIDVNWFNIDIVIKTTESEMCFISKSDDKLLSVLIVGDFVFHDDIDVVKGE